MPCRINHKVRLNHRSFHRSSTGYPLLVRHKLSACQAKQARQPFFVEDQLAALRLANPSHLAVHLLDSFMVAGVGSQKLRHRMGRMGGLRVVWRQRQL